MLRLYCKLVVGEIVKKIFIVAALALAIVPTSAYAAPTPTLNQTVNPGTLSTDVLGSDGTTPVGSPTVNFPAINKGFTCQTNTATLGDASNRLYVTNLASNNGWNIAIAATGGAAANWTAGGNTYKYNDAAGTGCTNGQMTVDPSVSTITLDCSSSCTATGLIKGTSTAFDGTTTTSVTLLTKPDGAAWRGYVTGVGLSQKIPAGQAAGAYSLPMTITVTAT
jgi:hypothetical protein